MKSSVHECPNRKVGAPWTLHRQSGAQTVELLIHAAIEGYGGDTDPANGVLQEWTVSAGALWHDYEREGSEQVGEASAATARWVQPVRDGGRPGGGRRDEGWLAVEESFRTLKTT